MPSPYNLLLNAIARKVSSISGSKKINNRCCTQLYNQPEQLLTELVPNQIRSTFSDRILFASKHKRGKLRYVSSC